MYKLVILVEPQDDSTEFDRRWPDFLALAERMPGLRREVTAHVDRVLHGKLGAHLIHELHFDSLKTAGEAMASIEGQSAGQLLQEISGGKVTLLLADHLQDELSHIHRRSPLGEQAPPASRA
ncbi:MAG: EthD family reductase [Anaerolineales bacterium]